MNYINKIDKATDMIIDELRHAKNKHPGWPIDPIHAAGILCEEAGETMQAAIDFVYSDANIEKMEHEAAQAGAMAFRILISIQEYKRTKAVQI